MPPSSTLASAVFAGRDKCALTAIVPLLTIDAVGGLAAHQLTDHCGRTAAARAGMCAADRGSDHLDHQHAVVDQLDACRTEQIVASRCPWRTVNVTGHCKE